MYVSLLLVALRGSMGQPFGVSFECFILPVHL